MFSQNTTVRNNFENIGLNSVGYDAGKIMQVHQEISQVSQVTKQQLLKVFEMLDEKKVGHINGHYFRKLLTATGEKIPDREVASFLSKQNAVQKFSYKDFVQQM